LLKKKIKGGKGFLFRFRFIVVKGW